MRLRAELGQAYAALRELARWGKWGGGDCWCTEAPKDFDGGYHSPGCKAAREAFKLKAENGAGKET